MDSGMVNRETLEQTMKVIEYQSALQQQEQLISTINEKCFQMCVTKPGAALDNAQQKCLVKCLDRYVDAWNSVAKTVQTKIVQQANMQ